jgi:hypothetical protein
MTIYSWADDWNPGDFPTVLAIGDSWFWYPKANSLLEALERHPRLKDEYRSMARLGQNGALLSEYVDVPGRPGKYSKQLNALLKPANLRNFSVFLVSGAGNDAVDYMLGLNPDSSKAASAEDCISTDGMGQLLKTVNQALGLLLHEVIWAFTQINRTPYIFLHSYDYALPDGRGFELLPEITLLGPWLKPAMDACKVPNDMALRNQIVHILINRIADVFSQYQNPKNGIYLIDSRGTLTAGAKYQDDWDNELHPTGSGFDRIVDQHWIPTFQQLGLANQS